MSRITRTIALTLALGALTASPASAQDLRMPDTRDAAGGGQPYQQRSSAEPHETPAAQDLRGADALGAPTEGNAGVVVLKAPPAAEPATGIDWGDAGIGAGGLLGLTLIGLGGTLVILHRRQRIASSR